MIHKYGYTFPAGTNDLTMELHAYKNGRTEEKGGLGKFQHFKNAVDILYNNPQAPASRNFIWSPWAEDMLYEACHNRYLSVAGCASSGKSDSFALYGIINYLASPVDTLVLMTSTTMREARRRIWKSTMDLWCAVPGLPGKLVNSMGMIKGLSKDGQYYEATGISLVPAERKKEKEAIGKLAGIKQINLILVADELPELPESLVITAVTNMAANDGFQMIGLGNPASHFDAFGMFSEPKDGWHTVTEADMEWDTELGKCIRFDAQYNPNLTEPGKYPWMPSEQAINQAKALYTENSLYFYRMIKGFWCPEGAEKGIYSEADLIRAMGKRPVEFDSDPTPVSGMDPSFSSGGDRCIAFFGKLGKVDGRDVLEITEHLTLSENINDKESPRTHQLADQYRRACIQRGVKPEHAAIDSTGGGAPFHDVLAKEWSPSVLAINFSGRASEKRVSATDKAKGHERYHNRMSEIWFQAKELLRGDQLKGITTELAREMISREYEAGSTGKVKVETKKDLKMRIGKSPDLADSAFVMIELCRMRLGLMGGERFEVSEKRRNVWVEKMRKLDVVGQSEDSTLLDI